jgi:RNA polymerase sigma factor (sigma-70 family)
MSERLHVLTGAPGSGKTAILSRIRGTILCVAEPAREILVEERARGGDGTADGNPYRFVELLLQRSIQKHAHALESERLALFDRGVPDCVAYAKHLGADPEPSRRAAILHRYNRDVLITKVWKEIYTTDDERRMKFDATVAFQDLIEAAYSDAGYSLVEVPRGTMGQRVAFVEKFVSAGASAAKPDAKSTARPLERIGGGGREALEHLAERYFQILRRLADALLPGSVRPFVDIDDLVQTTLNRALTHWGDFVPRHEGAFLAYLRRLMRDQIMDEIRRVRSQPFAGPLEERDTGADAPEAYEAALAELTEVQQGAVIMRLELGFSYAEIAEALQIQSTNAARTLIARAIVEIAAAMRRSGFR